MTITLEVENEKNELVKYDGFTNISVTRSMEALSGGFNFTATAKETIKFPIKIRQKCRVFVNNTKVIDGFIENIGPSYTSSSHSIAITGRDKTADIIDSSLKSQLVINPKISLKNVIEKVLENLGITDIEVIDNVGNISLFNETEVVASNIGQNAFDFIESYCRKRQVLCTTDGNGNIALERASSIQIPTLLINIRNGLNNNILNANCSYDDTNRFNTVIVRSQENPSAFNFSNENVIDISATEIDKEIRNTRSITVFGETSMNIATAKERAKWEINVRKARALTYSPTIQGFSYNKNGDIWIPNRLVSVIDEDCDINSVMLIKSLTYNLSLDSGSTTTFELVNKNSYTLQIEEAEREKKRKKEGNDFIKEILEKLGI